MNSHCNRRNRLSVLAAVLAALVVLIDPHAPANAELSSGPATPIPGCTPTSTAPQCAPSGLSYVTPSLFPLDVAITPLTPKVTGIVLHYTVTPALPSGLALSASTGVISGTPLVAVLSTLHTVTASNLAGSTTFKLTVPPIKLVPPTALSYPSPSPFLLGKAIAPLHPRVIGFVQTYSVIPALPAGLSINASTGVISGTPGVIAPLPRFTRSRLRMLRGGRNSLSI